MAIKAQGANNYEGFKKRLLLIDTNDLAHMRMAVMELNRAFNGVWSDIPNVTLKEFIGLIEDEPKRRLKK